MGVSGARPCPSGFSEANTQSKVFRHRGGRGAGSLAQSRDRDCRPTWARTAAARHDRHHRRVAIVLLVVAVMPDAPVREAWRGLNADCPKREAMGAGERCDLHAPQLSALFMRTQTT